MKTHPEFTNLKKIVLMVQVLQLVAPSMSDARTTVMNNSAVLDHQVKKYLDRSPAQIAPVKKHRLGVKEIQNILETNFSSDSPVRMRDLALHIQRLSMRYRFSPEFILAVMFVESSFNNRATSSKGAKGLMQLMPDTAAYFSKKMSVHFYANEKDLYNPYLNTLLGVGYLAHLRDQFKSFDLVLAAYNLGPTTVRRMVNDDQMDLSSIKFYIDRVKQKAIKFRDNAPAKQVYLSRM